jgi:ribosome-binding protein aMBF1 (putative translation factor)
MPGTNVVQAAHDGDRHMKRSKARTTSDALEIIHRRFYAARPERLAQLEEAIANDDIARKIRRLRDDAAVTQRQLAKLVGTTASVICRLEDAEYEGHSLAMLNRIAAAMNKRVKIEFVAAPKQRKSA